MPRTRSIVWSELKLGIVGIVAVLMASILIIAVGGQGGFFWQRYPLKTRFDDVQGMKTGAVVRLSGMEIGKVTVVEFVGTRVEVTMEVSKDVRSLITTDSIATIGSLSLLGESIVDITSASTGRPIPDWGYVKSGVGGGPLGALQTTAKAGLDDATQILAKMRAGEGTLGKLITDEALYRDLDQFVTSASAVTRAINEGKGTIGSLMKDPSAYNSLKTSLENLQAVTEKMKDEQSPLGRLLHDDAMGKSLGATAANLEDVTARLKRGEGTAGKLLTDQQLYDRLNTMVSRVDQLISDLNAGKGTAGQLLRDQQLYETMNQAASELRDLLAAIRKDPKKYLRVSVSIF
ncbi:MAG TPA: MlaD family protein [Vicinamibacterales bacterium]|nr:MlaD family protein [Vicinamibacterales bacterium]